MLESITRVKILENVSAIKVLILIIANMATWFALKKLLAYFHSKKQEISKNIKTEQKIVTELTIKFLNGLGPEFKKAIKAYTVEKCTEDLEQAKEYFKEMTQTMIEEEKRNIQVNKVNNIYANTVKNIVSFEWCQ
jgi:hypothetical protein